MKVVSLIEPYVTLIKEKKKFVETRGWKTDYRGKSYIHASMTSISKECKKDTKFMALIDNIPLNFGNINCKCISKLPNLSIIKAMIKFIAFCIKTPN